jgi:cell division protein FtsA
MQSDVLAILESRTQELLFLLKEAIDTQKLRPLMHAGLVLTGGGSLLYGIKEQAEAILQMPVRMGRPRVPLSFKEALDNPIYATGYGLLVHTLRRSRAGAQGVSGAFVTEVFSRMKSWVFDFF